MDRRYNIRIERLWVKKINRVDMGKEEMVNIWMGGYWEKVLKKVNLDK